jgi:hypothetical protein
VWFLIRDVIYISVLQIMPLLLNHSTFRALNITVKTALFVVLFSTSTPYLLCCQSVLRNQRILHLPGVLCWLAVLFLCAFHFLHCYSILYQLFFFVRNISASRGSSVDIVTRLWVGRPGARIHFSVLQKRPDRL